MKEQFLKKMINMPLITLILLISNRSALAVVEMTPYPTYQSPPVFWQGAEYELEVGKDFDARIKHDLPDMKYNYNINCLNLYGLENLSTAQLDTLFGELKELDMQAVVRIEWYEASWMNFDTTDADLIISHYIPIIQYVCNINRRNQVAYFALNVPVDDPDVAAHFVVTNEYPDGRRNPLWASSQVTYVEYFVSQMRNVCNSYGFTNAKQYVSVYYGWDYSYPTPSYASSNADGYSLWNTTYPQDKTNPPDENDPDSIIINRARLQIGMDKFMTQYPNASQKKIIEYAFHTSEFNDGVNPDQDAGLVKTIAAKQKGLRATTTYYDPATFAGLRGTQYFSWNLLKAEGNPPLLLDWCLTYPKEYKTEAENCTLYGNVYIFTDGAASNGQGVAGLDGAGDALAIFQATKSDAIQIRYACSGNGQLSLYIDGQYKQKVNFPSTGSWTGIYDTVTVIVNVPWGATVRLQYESGDSPVNVDYIQLMSYSNVTTIEAENGTVYGNATVYSDGAASNGEGVGSLDNNGDAVEISGVPESSAFSITYACDGNNQLSFYMNGAFIQKINFPTTGAWTGTYATVGVNVSILAGAAIKLQHDAGDVAANIDYFSFGTGLKSAAINNSTDNNAANNNIGNASRNIIVYPNPFHNEMNINLSQNPGFKKLRIIDEAGRLIEEKNIEGIPNLSIGNGYKPGIYTLELISNKKIKSIVIVKR